MRLLGLRFIATSLLEERICCTVELLDVYILDPHRSERRGHFVLKKRQTNGYRRALAARTHRQIGKMPLLVF